MADTQITAAQIIADFGSYYIDAGQNQRSLLMRPFEIFGTKDAFTNVPTKDTQVRYSDVSVSEILQAYQDTYTPKGSVTFKPVKIDLQQVKIDQEFNPNKLINTWLGFLTNNNTDRKTWPFIKWIVEVYLLQQLFDDMETQAIYGGEYEAPADGVAGAANTIMDGVKKQINDKIDADETVPIITGAPAADAVDFCEQIEAFAESIPEKYWKKKLVINMSRTLELRFRKGKDKKYNTNYAQSNNLTTLEYFPTIQVAGRGSMQGTSKIWATPIENAIFLTKGFENSKGFELESVDRKVKIWTDFWVGLGFLQGDMIFTNDQDLA